MLQLGEVSVTLEMDTGRSDERPEAQFAQGFGTLIIWYSLLKSRHCIWQSSSQ